MNPEGDLVNADPDLHLQPAEATGVRDLSNLARCLYVCLMTRFPQGTVKGRGLNPGKEDTTV